MMLDKLDTRIPSVVGFRPVLREVERELRMTGGVQAFKRSEHYRAVGDLRQFGIPAILHLGNKHTPEANHKLELVETGRMSYSEMLVTIERVCDVDPRSLEVMRVDPAADVEGVPVGWFKEHCRAAFKRFAAEYEDVK